MMDISDILAPPIVKIIIDNIFLSTQHCFKMAKISSTAPYVYPRSDIVLLTGRYSEYNEYYLWQVLCQNISGSILIAIGRSAKNLPLIFFRCFSAYDKANERCNLIIMLVFDMVSPLYDLNICQM
jgi:hypothetical protein